MTSLSRIFHTWDRREHEPVFGRVSAKKAQRDGVRPKDNDGILRLTRLVDKHKRQSTPGKEQEAMP